MRSFIIHMTGEDKRRPNVETLLDILPNAEVVPAVVGRERMSDFPIKSGDAHIPRYPFVLGPGEVGCFLSHRACWQRVIDDGLDYALIVEDDLGLDMGVWTEALDLISAHGTADDFIRLPAKPREKPVRIIDNRQSARLFLPKVIGLQTVAQVVGRNAARRLLAASEVLDRPVDTFLQMHWVTGQPIQTILPNGVRELTDDLGGSTIQKKSPPEGKFSREMKRALYRAQVALCPQRPH